LRANYLLVQDIMNQSYPLLYEDELALKTQDDVKTLL